MPWSNPKTNVSFPVTFALSCDTPGRYCIEYNDGTLHDVLTFEAISVISGVFAIFGYFRASSLFRSEQRSEDSFHGSSLSSPDSEMAEGEMVTSPTTSLLVGEETEQQR